MDSSETILLLNLAKSEKKLVRHLVAPFEIVIEELTIRSLRRFVRNHPDKKIALVVYKVSLKYPRQDRLVLRLRKLIGPLAPVLVLVPEEKSKEIKKYIHNGADDFIQLPLNQDRFSISFLILLEMGRIIAEQQHRRPPKHDLSGQQEPSPLNRIIHLIQEGIHYFTPRSLIQRRGSEYIFDRWEQLKKLGTGGFGTVWLVKEIGTEKLAVAKIPFTHEMNIRTLRAAAILKRLVHHPNIVHLIEIVKDGGKLILIQEYINGPTLQELLKAPIPPRNRESFFLQLVSVVSHAHRHKILHRDIKPENILITKSGQLKLLDFGIARDLSWQSPGSSSEGTVNYMPPEQFAGKGCLASDVWALGVILYIFAVNKMPYWQHNEQYPMDIETKIQSQAPSNVNPAIDPQLEKVILTCLETDLNKRYQNGTELENDLRRRFQDFGSGSVLPDFPSPEN